jgi:hypothetical protein
LYIGYQRVEHDEHGDRYPFNVRPKQVKITTAAHSASHQLVDKREVQRIVLDGSPIRSLRIDVEDVYLAKDKDCSFSEIVVYEKPSREGLAAYDGSFLKPGTTLVYRDESFDYSSLQPDVVAEDGLSVYQGYMLVRLLPHVGAPRGFTVGEDESSKEAMENLSGYFWNSGNSYFWGGGGVYDSEFIGHAYFPALANSGDGGGSKAPGLATGESVASDSYSAPHDDNETDAEFNAHFGYVYSDGSGFAGVSAGQTATLVDAYPTDAEPDKFQRGVAEEVVKGRFEEWKAARLESGVEELSGFYAKTGKHSAASRAGNGRKKTGDELVHVPGAMVTYEELAIHVGPKRIVTSFHEIVSTSSGKIYFLRELDWQLEGKDLLIFDQRVVRRVEAEEPE